MVPGGVGPINNSRTATCCLPLERRHDFAALTTSFPTGPLAGAGRPGDTGAVT